MKLRKLSVHKNAWAIRFFFLLLHAFAFVLILVLAEQIARGHENTATLADALIRLNTTFQKHIER